MFKFAGHLLASKSWMNRALILQSWNPDIKIHGTSSADDVVRLQRALVDWRNGQTTFDAGHGGTTFRFLAVRLSREPGRYFIKASPSLVKRPQQDLIHFLESVGVKSHLRSDGLEIQSEGWRATGKTIPVNTENSSQFISAVLLSSLNLQQQFILQLSDVITSESYLQMTLALLRQVGVNIRGDQQKLTVPPGLKTEPAILKAEIDISSAFSLICAAVIDGDVTITNWSNNNSQPDLVFLKIFEQMKINFQSSESHFSIRQQDSFIGTEFDIGQSPDLFPVLCVLAAFAKTTSRFYGAPQLKFKESDRLQKTAELLELCGIEHEVLEDGMIIQPWNGDRPVEAIKFDPADDHRMAMAAALFKLKLFPIQILHPEVVQKSYPDFFEHINLDLANV